ncbi:MAG: CHAT domain-containing protein [Bacteroidota bacterium]|nr:CHAT domain-containing protein [Bacteroidota bacterium]
MKLPPLILLFLLFVIGCSDNSNQQPNEKAERLTQQAEVELNKQNYEEAERLLIESINIHTETDNEAKLAENYSTLATAQILSGKLSSAVESLIALRGYYRHAADRNAELHAMLQIGNIYFQLGKAREALSILNEAFNSSQLYQLEQIRAKAAMDVASVYTATGHHEAAMPYLISAAVFYQKQNDIPHLLQTECVRIAALIAIGKIDEAFEVYQKTESLLQANPSSMNESFFFLKCGESFAAAGEFSFAKSCFEYGLMLIGKQSNDRNSKYKKHLQIGLGELYFRNFAFTEAQNHFTKAYETAKNELDSRNGIVVGYLLVRIADCIAKDAALQNRSSSDGIIRGTQLYEQAQTYFARAGLGFGEAIALHRLGMIRQLSKDDNAAITFYKRAFEKFSHNTIPTAFFTLPVNVQRLCTSISQTNSIEFWFSNDLISLLLNYRKFSEALSYYETVRNMKLQSELSELQLQFHESAKNKRYTEFQKATAKKTTLQMELFHLNTLQKPNKNYASKVQQELTYVQSKTASDGITIAQEYPVFSFLNGTQKSSLAAVSEAIPPASTVLEYCFAGNEMWVFVARNNEEITAVKLSPFGYSLSNRMKRFMDLLNRSTLRTGLIQLEANELYSFLVQPIESYGRQSFIIIPPIGLEKFPFHTLLKNERSLIEMMDVSYLPSISFVQSNQSKTRTLQNSAAIAAFGFTTDSRWGLEFELRDIRSFFKNTQANVNLSATPEKLSAATGDVLQLASPFQKNVDGEYSFLLSSGSTLKSGVALSIEKFASYHPYPIVYLSDVQSSTNNISVIHPLLWMLNGSTSVIATQFPITSNISKSFSENFYNSLLSEETPAGSYRRSVTLLERKKELYGGFAGASYFYYGVK